MDRSLREQVLQCVRAQILSGERPPGSLCSVPTLAASLGISTTPVREALLELARNGLIEPLRNRGFRVVGRTRVDLRNLFDLSEVLEFHAAIQVARSPARSCHKLTPLADEVVRAVRDRDIKLYLEADRNFHQSLAEIANNPRLTAMVTDLRDQMRLYEPNSDIDFIRLGNAAAEHYEIIALATVGELERLANLIRGHLRDFASIFDEPAT